MNYYERYCGDYARDTGHLSLQEHGVYTVMLDTYYATEKPLPADHVSLYRICRAMTGAEREAVRKVADEFFPVADDGLRHNKRADETIAKARKRIEAARTNGAKNKEPTGIPTGLPNGSASPQPTGHIGTTTRPQTPINLKTLSATADFDQFYDLYPRKEKKHEALKAFLKISPDEPLFKKMLAALVVARESEQWRKEGGKFIPLPTSWLNGKRWEDEATAIAQPKQGLAL